MSFFESLLGGAVPGELLNLAREVSALMAALGQAPAGSHSHFASAGKIFERRTMLARSEPATDLDMLALVFTARQAVRLLQTIDLAHLDEEKRAYWTGEITDALRGVQSLLERQANLTMEEMGFEIEHGRRVN